MGDQVIIKRLKPNVHDRTMHLKHLRIFEFVW